MGEDDVGAEFSTYAEAGVSERSSLDCGSRAAALLRRPGKAGAMLPHSKSEPGVGERGGVDVLEEQGPGADAAFDPPERSTELEPGRDDRARGFGLFSVASHAEQTRPIVEHKGIGGGFLKRGAEGQLRAQAPRLWWVSQILIPVAKHPRQVSVRE